MLFPSFWFFFFPEDGEDLKGVSPSLKRMSSCLAPVVSTVKSWPCLLSDENVFRSKWG